VSDRIEIYTSSIKRERGGVSLERGDAVTVRVCDVEGRSIFATVTAGEWSRLLSNPKHC
jgi:hypothetical protein